MRSSGDQPRELRELLDVMAGRLRRVDLRLIDEVRRRWPEVVGPVLAEHCRPEFIKDGVLVVSVPSGAFAQRVMSERGAILEALGSLGERAPSSLRTVLAAP